MNEENLNDTNTPSPDPPQAETPEFVRLVKTQLDAKGIKPKCPGCSAIGWANFEVFPFPSVTQTVSQAIMFSAVIHCLKCGLKTERNLNVLGITIQQEERRVLTASEIAQQQQKPLIVTG